MSTISEKSGVSWRQLEIRQDNDVLLAIKWSKTGSKTLYVAQHDNAEAFESAAIDLDEKEVKALIEWLKK